MRKIFIRVLYGVEQMVFSVGKDGNDKNAKNCVKKHFDPITRKSYAYASSASVKRNIKQLFSELSGIRTPDVEFGREVTVKGNSIMIKGDGEKEQGGVSVLIDVENPICSIFGAWNSDTLELTQKYTKAALKSCLTVSDMIPIHPLLQCLSKPDEVGVFVGDKNSKVVLNTKIGDKNVTLRSPEEASKMVGCSIDDARDAFGRFRPMNIYKDKQTANGLYQETFSIDVDVFGKVKLSSCTIPQETCDRLLSEGWRKVSVRGEDYLSPQPEKLIKLWDYFIDSLIDWDFSSNDSLHGSKKECLRYSVSTNMGKLNQCTTAVKYYDDENNERARLALRDSCEVYSFNTTNLEKWHVCDGSDGGEKIDTDIDADYKVKDLLKEMGRKMIS